MGKAKRPGNWGVAQTVSAGHDDLPKRSAIFWARGARGRGADLGGRNDRGL